MSQSWKQPSQTTIGWTDERVDLLKKLWQDGLSASQIAKELGGVTRNAVIGKVHRLGLSGRETPAKPQRTYFKAPRPVTPRRAQAFAFGSNVPAAVVVAPPPPPPPGRTPVPDRGIATVISLGNHMCKWPIGDPTDESFTLCGRQREPRAGVLSPYCDEHAALAYQPPTAKKRSAAAELSRSLRRYL